MAITYINTGSGANAGDGDSIRAAFIKVNNNFSYLSAYPVTSSTQYYHVIPALDNTYNLGSTLKSWSNLYIDNTIILNSSTLAVNTVGNLIFNNVPISITSVGENPPAAPSTGTTWYDTVSGELFIYYDGSWVDTNPSGGMGGGGSTNLTSVNSNIYPRVSSIYNIGTPTAVWNNLHINRAFFGTNTLTVNTANILTFNGTAVQGQSGPTGPVGPTGLVGGTRIVVTATNDNLNFVLDDETDPTIQLIRGFTYYFDVNTPGYNFWIKTSPVTGFGSGYPGVINNGTSTGIVQFTVPRNAAGVIYYIDQNYGAMAGTFNTIDYQAPGPTGAAGPTGPSGPGANQALNTTSSVRFRNLTVDGTAIFNSTVTYVANQNTIYTDSMIELHSAPSGDQLYNVINNGASEWLLDGVSNPTITLVRNRTYRFAVVAINHPFYIKTAPVTGLGNTYDEGVTNNGTEAGNLDFTVPSDAPATLYYICGVHSSMFGIINVVDEGDPSVQWTVNDGNDIGFRFHYFDTQDRNAGLLLSNQDRTLDWYSSGLSNVFTATFTGTFGKFRTGSIELKTTASVITFADGRTQNVPFQGTASFATSATFASTSTTATDAFNVLGGSIQGSVVNGTTSTTQVGYLVVPQVSLFNTSTYTLSINDQGKHLYSITTTSQTVTIPPYIFAPFPTGTAVTVVLRGIGTVAINTGVGVTLILAGTEEVGNRTLLANGMATLLKVEQDIWFINGTGLN